MSTAVLEAVRETHDAYAAAELRLGRHLTVAERHIDIVALDRDLASGKENLYAAVEKEKRRAVRAHFNGGRPVRLKVTTGMVSVLSGLYDKGTQHAKREIHALTGTRLTDREFAAKQDLGKLTKKLDGHLKELGKKVAVKAETLGGASLGLDESARFVMTQQVAKMPGALNVASQMVSSAMYSGVGSVYSAEAGLFGSWQYSAVMDNATCDVCAELDGAEYASWDDIQEVLPDGGPNPDCDGEGRCRCRVVPGDVQTAEETAGGVSGGALDVGGNTLAELVDMTLDEDVAELGPTQIEMWRVGPAEDHIGRGVFFGDSPEAVTDYASLHPGHQVTRYVVETERTAVYDHQYEAFQELFGEDLAKYLANKQTVEGKTLIEAWHTAEVRIADKLRGNGFDSILYKDPPPPALHELAIITKKPIENLAERSTDEAVQSWVEDGSALNVFLRGDLEAAQEMMPGTPGVTFEAMAKKLDTAFTPSSVDETYWRGVSAWREALGLPYDANPSAIKVGQKFTDKAYTSVTKNRAMADVFGDNEVVFRVKIPGGTKTLDITKLNEQEEVLLPRNTEFRVVAKTSDDQGVVVTVEVVAKEEPLVAAKTSAQDFKLLPPHAQQPVESLSIDVAKAQRKKLKSYITNQRWHINNPSHARARAVPEGKIAALEARVRQLDEYIKSGKAPAPVAPAVERKVAVKRPAWAERVRQIQDEGYNPNDPSSLWEAGKLVADQARLYEEEVRVGLQGEVWVEAKKVVAAQLKADDARMELLKVRGRYRAANPDTSFGAMTRDPAVVKQQKAVDRLQTAYNAASRKHQEAITQEKFAIGRAYLRALSEVRQMGGKIRWYESEYRKLRRGKAHKVLDRSTDVFPSDWLDNMNPIVAKLTARGRGQNRRVGLYNEVTVRDELTNAIHELAHVMEDSIANVKLAEHSFFNFRAAGELPTPLGGAYARNEIGVKDKFSDRYMGKVYRGATPTSNYELLTRGMESLFSSSRYDRAVLDDDYLHWLLGLLSIL